MKNDLKLGYRMFVRNLKINSLVILQIAVALCLGLSLLSCVSSIGRSSHVFKNFKNAKAVYYDDTAALDAAMMRAEGVEVEEVDGTLTASLEQVKFRSMVKRTPAYLDEKRRAVELFGMDRNLISLFDIPVKKGVWLSRAESDLRVQAVVSPGSGLKVGETATVSYFGKDEYGNMLNYPLNVHIVGILSSPVLIPSPGSGGIPCSSAFCETEVNVDKNTVMMVIATDTLPKDRISSIDAVQRQKSEYIVFNDTIDEETYQRNLALIAQKGEIATPEEMKKQDALFLKSELSEYLPMAVIFLVLSLLGITCAAFVCVNENMHNFSVYFVCGSTWRRCRRMIAGYLAVSVGAVLALVWLLSLLVNAGLVSVLPAFVMTPWSAWYIVAVLAFYVAIFMALARYQLRHNSPVTLLKSTTE